MGASFEQHDGKSLTPKQGGFGDKLGAIHGVAVNEHRSAARVFVVAVPGVELADSNRLSRDAEGGGRDPGGDVRRTAGDKGEAYQDG
jgi:hypothetical protein